MSEPSDSQLTTERAADASAEGDTTLLTRQTRQRNCVVNPPYEPLTEDTLLKLEQSQPQYCLAQRNLAH